jgi:hypothetical protein
MKKMFVLSMIIMTVSILFALTSPDGTSWSPKL